MPDVANPTPNVPYADFAPGTAIASDQMDANFAHVIAQLTAHATALNDLDAANLVAAVVERLHEPGDIKMSGRAAATSGWLMCDGSAVSRSTYAALFAAVGTTFGVGDGSSTFNVPDMRGRFPLGKAAAGTGSTLGAAGGALDHTHAVAGHSHYIGHSHAMAGNMSGEILLGSAGSHYAPGGAFDHNHATGNTAGMLGGGPYSNDRSESVALTSGASNPAYGVVNFMVKT